jgi:hypothetical protein
MAHFGLVCPPARVTSPGSRRLPAGCADAGIEPPSSTSSTSKIWRGVTAPDAIANAGVTAFALA